MEHVRCYRIRRAGYFTSFVSLDPKPAAYCYGPMKYEPFALSSSKGFDRLSPNGT